MCLIHPSTKHNFSKGTFLQQFIFHIFISAFMIFFATFSSLEHLYLLDSKGNPSVSRARNSPSINGELSLSTFCFSFHHQFISGSLYDEQ